MRRVSLRPVLLLAPALVSLLALSVPGRAWAQCTEHGACLLPQAGCGYFLQGPVGYGTTSVMIRNVNLSNFTQCMPPQPPAFAIDSFFDVFVELEITGDGGAHWQPAQTTGHGHEHAVGRPDGMTFDTEMLQLDLSGGSLPPGVQIRESTSQPSHGQTMITDLGGGNFRIDSFFDVFTDLSLDSGGTWTPSNGSSRTTVTPESVTPVRRATWGSLKTIYR